jgi:glyoxylase-like metal-dependent hydrolase (beta-lactamase superfamily II)
VILAGDIGYVHENYADRVPMSGALCWNKEAWFESCDRLADLERRLDATVFVGHDPAVPDRLRAL